MKYSEIIGVEQHFKSAFDITSDSGDAWKTFITNDKFEANLSQIITSFTSPVFNNRKSIWIQGTYGTGKSHSLAVIKHLLSDDYSEIEDYIPKINHGQLRNRITSFRKDKRVFPVILKGIYTITDVADLTYTIQQQVEEALRDIEISTKTDFQSVVQTLEKGSMDSFVEDILHNNIELKAYASNKQQLIDALNNHETKVLRILASELKDLGLGGFRNNNIVDWLKEVKTELQERGIADYLLLIWDEFTSLLDIPQRRAILNVMQDIAELSFSEVKDNSDTVGVYLLLVTHKKLEATESYKDLKEDERQMAKARFVELDYDMQPTTTYHILSGALDRKNTDVLNDLVQKNFLGVPSVRMIVDKVVDSDATNAKEIKNKIISLYPFHPYTSYLATFVSRVVGEAERSIFGFLNDEKYGFKKFIQEDVEDKKFLTADYVWDFFYKTFEQNAAGHFDSIINKFKLSGEKVLEHGKNEYAVFKTILLLNILYRVTTTDADVSERSMVIPNVENISGAYSGVLSESELSKILDYIDENQVLHRNPDGVFEVSSSALPQKRILEEKQKLYASKEDVSKIFEEYPLACVGRLRKIISRDIFRELDVQVFWGGDKEYLLKNKLLAKFKYGYMVNVAVVLYRGATKNLDEYLGRTETEQQVSRKMIAALSTEVEFQNIVFILVNTELGNKRYEAYLDSLAQETVARSLQLEEERVDAQKNAEKWISQWASEIVSSGMADLIFRGDIIHVPFSTCSKHFKTTYVKAIFRYGLDSVPAANTAWNHQTSKKAVELVLYASYKSELETASGSDGVVKTLLTYGNTVLFDDKLNLVCENSNIPVVKICQEVKAVIDKNKNETSINLAKELEFFTQPEYGFYQTRLYMGTLALALRPYVDKLYTSGNGHRIDKTLMKEVVVSIFKCWENEKHTDKFIVRMSTEEERALTENLKTIFGLTDADGLLGTKWAIRDKFNAQSKAPLWALKYIGTSSEKYKTFIDKMFKFSKSADENIQQPFIVELLEGVKTYSVELSNAVKAVENSQCLDSFIIDELNKIGEASNSLDSVYDYLKGHLSGNIAFWEEDEVHEQILLWKISTDSPAPALDDSQVIDDEESSKFPSQPLEFVNIDHVNETVKERVEQKLENSRSNGEKLYSILMILTERYPAILSDLDDLM